MSAQVFTSMSDFYKASPYAAFQQDHRRGGSFGVEMLMAEQDGHELTDPAVPQFMIVAVLKARGLTEFDFGDGWVRHNLVSGGFVDLQPPNQECRFRVCEPHTVLCAYFPVDRAVQHLGENGLSLAIYDGLYARLAGSRDAVLLLQMMWRAMREGGAANDLLVDGCLIALLGYFARLAGKEIAFDPPGLDDRRLQRVIDYVEAHFGDPIRMDDLAQVACLSLAHFSKAFKAAVGQTPHGYVTARRVAQARRMLAATNLPATDIGFLCGFGTPSHFSAVFTRTVGASPTAYRLYMGRTSEA